MKRLSILIVLLIISTLVFGEELIFNSTLHYENQIVICINQETVEAVGGKVEGKLLNGILITGIEEIDLLSKKYNFDKIEQTIEFVKDKKWNDNGIYPMNIYRITIEDNSIINQALMELQQQRNILFAEFEPKTKVDLTPNDPYYSTQWHLAQISCNDAWDITTGNDQIVIGIVDSGIKWNHPDLRDNIWINQEELDAGMTINWANGTVSGGNNIDDDGNGKIDDVIGWNFYENGSNHSIQTNPSNDHGTHVAGCAGAVGNNNLGVVGATMNVKLISSRHSPTSFATTSIYNGNAGIYYCADSGADIINCSWGGSGGGTSSNTAINYAQAQGALVICAAGNDDTNNGIVHHYPSDADNAVAVAALNDNNQKTWFSNYGTPIDVSAPGENIWSTIISNNGYSGMDGTSMASPIVAGVCALIKSVNPTFTPIEIRERLEETCDNIDNVNPGYSGLLGAGVVNAYEAVLNGNPGLEPPQNLTYEILAGNSVFLDWDEPESIGNPSGVLTYDNGYDGNGIGTDSEASWECAARFTETELNEFYGSQLSEVGIILNSGDFSYIQLKIYEGGSYGNPGSLVYSEEITNQVLVGEYTNITLTNPIYLISGNEYWIGYAIDATGDHPSATDSGPMIPEKGGWMYFNDEWALLPELSATLDYNWCIKGFVTGEDGERILIANSSIVDEKLISYNSGILSSQKKEINMSRDTNRSLLGYNVYRDNIVIETINDPQLTDYTDENAPVGAHTYYITAVYSEGESIGSNIVDVNILELITPPENLTYELIDENDVLLQWNEPGSGGSQADVITYDSGYVDNGIGTDDEASWVCAARFTPDELADYYGSELWVINCFYNNIVTINIISKK